MKKENELTEKEMKHLSWMLTYINVVMCLIVIIMTVFLFTLLYFSLHK